MNQQNKTKSTMEGRTNPPTIEPMVIFEIDKLHNQLSNIDTTHHTIVNGTATKEQSGLNEKYPPHE